MNPNGQEQPGQNNTPPSSGPNPPASTFYGQPNPSQTPSAPQPAAPRSPTESPWGQQPYQQPAQPEYDQEPVAPQYSADYLDQIAPEQTHTTLFSGSYTWMIIGLAVVFMFAVGLIVAFSGNKNADTAETAYMRITNLIAVTNHYRTFIKSSKLSSTNSNFKIFMTGAQHDLIDPLAKNGVLTNKLDRDKKSREKALISTVEAKLEDARLNAILDRVYAREMAYQTQLLIELYKRMSKNISPDIASNAKKTLPNLLPLQKSLADFKEGD
jgi:hypothetical protein